MNRRRRYNHVISL